MWPVRDLGRPALSSGRTEKQPRPSFPAPEQAAGILSHLPPSVPAPAPAVSTAGPSPSSFQGPPSAHPALQGAQVAQGEDPSACSGCLEKYAPSRAGLGSSLEGHTPCEVLGCPDKVPGTGGLGAASLEQAFVLALLWKPEPEVQEWAGLRLPDPPWRNFTPLCSSCLRASLASLGLQEQCPPRLHPPWHLGLSEWLLL